MLVLNNILHLLSFTSYFLVNLIEGIPLFDQKVLQNTFLISLLADFNCFSKGQLISEQICVVLNFPKMQRKIARISALASKMGQLKKLNAHYHPN